MRFQVTGPIIEEALGMKNGGMALRLAVEEAIPQATCTYDATFMTIETPSGKCRFRMPLATKNFIKVCETYADVKSIAAVMKKSYGYEGPPFYAESGGLVDEVSQREKDAKQKAKAGMKPNKKENTRW